MRPDWKFPKLIKNSLEINVHYDQIAHDKISSYFDTVSLFEYKDEYPAYEAICEFHNQKISNCFVGHGATEVLDRIIRFLDFDNIYIDEPAFQMVRVYSEIYGKNILTSPENPPKNSLLYYANPNGHDGQLRNFNHNNYKYVVIDEVYSDFCPQYSKIQTRRDNEIVVKSLSKSLGIAGLRVGYCFSSSNIIERLQETRTNHQLNSIACDLTPKIIHLIPDVVERMNKTKEIWYNTYECMPTLSNFVVFKEQNDLTRLFGDSLRLALMDAKSYENLK